MAGRVLMEPLCLLVCALIALMYAVLHVMDTPLHLIENLNDNTKRYSFSILYTQHDLTA